jgi:hypothetical protein
LAETPPAAARCLVIAYLFLRHRSSTRLHQISLALLPDGAASSAQPVLTALPSAKRWFFFGKGGESPPCTGSRIEIEIGNSAVRVERQVMKRMKIAEILRIGAAVALAVTLATAWTERASAQEKGAQKLMQLKPIKTVQDIETLEAGDAVVMSCPKCKTITVAYIEPTFKATEPKEKVKMEHLCPGCETKIETRGVGKAGKQEVVHTCQKCGSKDIMCCVMKKGSGPTKGMEKEKK